MGSDILKLNLASSQATEQRRLDHLVFSLDRSKKDGFEMDPKQYFNNIKKGTTYFLTGTGGLSGHGYIGVDGEKIKVYFDAAVNWHFKTQNYPVTISPTRIVKGKDVNAIIYQRANSRGFQAIQIIAPSNQIDKLYDRLNK